MANYQYENSGAIVDVDNAVRVTFDLNPESFNDTKGTEFASVAIPGMSHPKHFHCFFPAITRI